MAQTIKEETIKFIKSLPDDVSMHDIMYHLYIKETVNQRAHELKEKKVNPISDKDAQEQIEKCLQ